MKRVATVILNRNLPEVTDRLYNHIKLHDGNVTDIFVVEAGSEDGHLSLHCDWHADWADARSHGLRYSRGMNFGLSQLWREEKFQKYDAFFLLTNDTELNADQTLAPMIKILDEHPRVGILSPCSKRWGERLLLQEEKTKYFWFIQNSAYMLRREFIESICCLDEPGFMNFLFDGSNFRGYGSENELIAKAYINDWAAAITTLVWAEENESHLLDKSDLIKTEGYDKNLQLFIDEGSLWMRKKYGFNSYWSMQHYVKSFYDRFFEFHPEYRNYKI
jgi:hypothetical protein